MEEEEEEEESIRYSSRGINLKGDKNLRKK